MYIRGNENEKVDPKAGAESDPGEQSPPEKPGPKTRSSRIEGSVKAAMKQRIPEEGEMGESVRDFRASDPNDLAMILDHYGITAVESAQPLQELDVKIEAEGEGMIADAWRAFKGAVLANAGGIASARDDLAGGSMLGGTDMDMTRAANEDPEGARKFLGLDS